jgi:hypothetical protein
MLQASYSDLGVASNATWWSTARSGGADGLGYSRFLGNGARFVSPGAGRVVVPRQLYGAGLGEEVIETNVPVVKPGQPLPTDPKSVEAFAKCCIAWEQVANQRQDATIKWVGAGIVGGLMLGGIVGFLAGRRGRGGF